MINKKGKIYFCSFGLELKHITLETIEILRKVDKIFLVAYDGGIEEFFIENKISLKKLVWLTHAKGEHIFKIAKMIATVAPKTPNAVAILTYGFPTFLNGYYESLKEIALRKKIILETVYAVGSVNPLFDLVGISNIPAEGVHLFNSLDFHLFKRIDEKKHFPCFIFNPHIFTQENMKKVFLNFATKLQKRGFSFYILEIASAGGKPTLMEKVEFKNEKDLSKISLRTTLFIKKCNTTYAERERN